MIQKLSTQIIWIITLNHNSSRCIWRAAPDIALSLSSGANPAAKCNMLFPSSFIQSANRSLIEPTASELKMLSWRFSTAIWNMLLFLWSIFHNRSKSKWISSTKNSTLPTSAAINRTSESSGFSFKFSISSLYNWRHCLSSSWALDCFDFSSFNFNPGIDNEKKVCLREL